MGKIEVGEGGEDCIIKYSGLDYKFKYLKITSIM